MGTTRRALRATSTMRTVSGRRSRSRQSFWLYCSSCRKHFGVKGRPREGQKVRCICGASGKLEDGFHLFPSEAQAVRFATMHNRLVREVKATLRSEGLDIKDSGHIKPDDLSVFAEFQEQEAPLQEALGRCESDVETHDAYNNLIELYGRYYREVPTAYRRCVETCHKDMELVPALIESVRKQQGRRRLRFISFRVLAQLHENDGDTEAAVEVCERARDHGLKGYDERLERLRNAIKA